MGSTNTILALCPKCTKYIPQFNLEDDSIFINCECGANEEIFLSEYIKFLKENPKRPFQYNTEKQKLCINCDNRTKNTFDLNEDSGLNDKKIQEAEEHLNIYMKRLRDESIMKYPKEKEKIKKAYEACRQRNKNILEFIQILTSNYNCEDKYMYENIKKVGSIKIIKYIEDNDVDSVIYYFWNYHLTNPKPIKIIINNKEPKIESLFLLNDSRLACCSIKGSINIYNIRNNYECDNIINDVSGLLGICQLENNKIVSWDIHSSISIWGNNGDTYYCLNTIPEAHQNTINKVVSLDNNKFASCSIECMIKIWNDEGNLIIELKEQELLIYSLLYIKNNNILISAGNCLCVWSTSTYQCMTKINKKKKIRTIEIEQLDEKRIITESDGWITIFNILNWTVESCFQPNDEFPVAPKFILLRDKITILCGFAYCPFFFYYNIKSKEFSKIKSLEQEMKDLIRIDDHTFATYSDVIKIWKY